jgi:signal transduction histidine kinase
VLLCGTMRYETSTGNHAFGKPLMTIEADKWGLGGRGWLIGLVYLASYVALDWASYVQPFGQFGITPWNPYTGLSFALVLLFGPRFIPLLFVAPFLADVFVRHMPAPWPVGLLLWLVVGAGYAAATLLLLNDKYGFDIRLPRLSDIWLLLLVAAVSTAVVAGLYVSILASASLIAWSDFNVAALRLWIGDLIGIAVVTPFALLVATGRKSKITWETAAQFAAMCVALWAVFHLPEQPQLYRFYLLFLPIIWISLRSGLTGACAGLVITQLALMFVIEILLPGSVDTTIYQEMMLVLTLTGLTAGGAVMEREQVEYRLRLQQDAHARLTRLGSINELSAAVAHEINQPLSAAATYTRLLAEELGEQEFSMMDARQSAEKANAQVQRAAAVVRRLRDLIQTGRTVQAEVQVSNLINAALEVVEPELQRAGVSIEVQIGADLPPASADALQIEQVLINLVRNANEAIEAAVGSSRRISVAARYLPRGELEIMVGDTGPGFSAAQIASPFVPFHSTKRGGLGMGLSLCRSIVEAHGGRIWLANGKHGAEVHFTLRDCGRPTP